MLSKHHHLAHVLCVSILVMISTTLDAISSLARNDAYPVFSTIDPHTFLYMGERLKYRDQEFAKMKQEHFGISFAVFGQNANSGKNIASEPRILDSMTQPIANEFFELGDLQGRTSMIALLYGAAPQGQSLATRSPTLEKAFSMLFTGTMHPFEDPTKIDPLQKFGYFSFPLLYRKRGIAFDLYAGTWHDFGANIKMRICNIRQIIREYKDLTCPPPTDTCPFNPSPLEAEQVVQSLMNQLCQIAKEINIDICNYEETSVDEVRFSLFWRHAFELNEELIDWPHFLIMPFAQLTGSISPGKDMPPNKLFAAPFGNDKHNAIGADIGVNIDFIDTIEIGVEIGATHFFDRDICNMPVPTSKYQRNLYPFATDVTKSPGKNWHFAGKIASYHFLDKFSFYFQYIIVEHFDDKICLKNPDAAFMPHELEKRSSFKAKMANIGVNYDISPNIQLGFLWQAPIDQRNTYRSSTVMVGLYGTF